MRIGIPSDRPGGLDAGVSAHFGHCDLFTAVEIKGRPSQEGMDDNKMGSIIA